MLERASRVAREWTRDVLINWLASSAVIPRPLRWHLLRLGGIQIKKSAISARCFFGSRKISIGRSCFLNYEVFVDGAAPVEIGDNCQIGPRVTILTGTHHIGNEAQRAGASRSAGVTIGAGSWIGAGAMILPGVVVGSGAVIGAGALVTSSCLPNALYVGAPAEFVRHLGMIEQEE